MLETDRHAGALVSGKYEQCAWCHVVRPIRETITFNGQVLCRDTDCLTLFRRASDEAFVHIGEYFDDHRSDGK